MIITPNLLTPCECGYRQEIDDLIAREKDRFDQQYQRNEDTLKNLTGQVDTLDDKLVDLNEMVVCCDYFVKLVETGSYLVDISAPMSHREGSTASKSSVTIMIT